MVALPRLRCPGSGVTILGSALAGSGTIQMTGGSLFAYQSIYVGNSGAGTVTQSGGSVSTSGYSGLYIGLNSGVTGKYELSGTGSLYLAGRENIGWYGTGEFSQTGGTHTCSTNLWSALGYNAGSTDL